MKFSIGQKIRIRRTDNYGEVTALLPGDLVQVKLDGGAGHIPLPAETLELADGATKMQPVAQHPPQQISNESTSRDNGIQVAFDPLTNNEAEPVAYEVYLLNSTDQKIIYELKALTHSDRRWTKVGQLEPYAKKRLETVEYRWLNEKLSLELDARTVVPGGTGPRMFKKVPIKGKTFFDKYTEVPELYREAHLYVVFPQLLGPDAAPASAPKTTLRALTKQQVASRPKPPANKPVKIERTNLRAKLDFDNTIDLHLEALVRDPESIPRDQVLSTQMRYFTNYLQMALKLGVDNIFVIHGVGTGVLKREIHKELDRTKYVRKYKNEYHEKYGYGATEVIFD